MAVTKCATTARLRCVESLIISSLTTGRRSGRAMSVKGTAKEENKSSIEKPRNEKASILKKKKNESPEAGLPLTRK
jgi:hypothetical protein